MLTNHFETINVQVKPNQPKMAGPSAPSFLRLHLTRGKSTETTVDANLTSHILVILVCEN